MQRTGLILCSVFLGGILVACTDASAGASPAGASSAAPSAVSTPAASMAVTSAPAAVLDPVIDDAASRTGVARDAITVQEAEAMTWTTGALGCPSPGVMYTQALVNGWRVIVVAGTKRIDYRVSAPGRFRVCEGLTGS